MHRVAAMSALATVWRDVRSYIFSTDLWESDGSCAAAEDSREDDESPSSDGGHRES